MLALCCGIFLSFSWEKLFLGETRLWLRLLHSVFVFEFVFSGISCCETRVWLCAAACTSTLAGQPSFVQSEAGVRQAGRCSADNDPPTKRCCKAIFIFWQQQISIKVVLGNIQGMVAHHLWGKHPIKSKLYSFYGMQLLLHIFPIFLAFEMLWCIF